MPPPHGSSNLYICQSLKPGKFAVCAVLMPHPFHQLLQPCHRCPAVLTLKHYTAAARFLAAHGRCASFQICPGVAHQWSHCVPPATRKGDRLGLQVPVQWAPCWTCFTELPRSHAACKVACEVSLADAEAVHRHHDGTCNTPVCHMLRNALSPEFSMNMLLLPMNHAALWRPVAMQPGLGVYMPSTSTAALGPPTRHEQPCVQALLPPNVGKWKSHAYRMCQFEAGIPHVSV